MDQGHVLCLVWPALLYLGIKSEILEVIVRLRDFITLADALQSGVIQSFS